MKRTASFESKVQLRRFTAWLTCSSQISSPSWTSRCNCEFPGSGSRATGSLQGRSCDRIHGRCRCHRKNSLSSRPGSCSSSDKHRCRNWCSDCLASWYPGTLDSASLLAVLGLRKEHLFRNGVTSISHFSTQKGNSSIHCV